VLAGILLINMGLLAPHLHVHGPATASLQGTQPAAAAAVDNRQHQGKRQRGVAAPKTDLWHDFDSNSDGVLGPAEFEVLTQVCGGAVRWSAREGEGVVGWWGGGGGGCLRGGGLQLVMLRTPRSN
jgi:hypothetical protein